MSRNCKAGDLAFIIRDRLGMDIGKVVEIKQAIGHVVTGQMYVDPLGVHWLASMDGFVWWVETRGSTLNSRTESGDLHRDRACPYYDSALRPLPGVKIRTKRRAYAPVEG